MFDPIEIPKNDMVPDEEIISRMKGNAPDSFDAMFKKYGAQVFRHARAILGSFEAAEDASQEIFLKAILGISNLRGNRLKPWLLSITHNFCNDLLRKIKKDPKTLFSTENEHKVFGKTPSGLPELIFELNPLEREVILLRVIDGLPYSEISNITEMAEGTLRNMVSKILKRLRERAVSDGL
ncbi:RNA polymerase sigma factor [bacterium]|nr:RNA polymerase sigma factor [bacterium]